MMYYCSGLVVYMTVVWVGWWWGSTLKCEQTHELMLDNLEGKKILFEKKDIN